MPNNKATRTANGSGSIRKRADGRWEGRYSVGSDPATGKQIQRSVYGKTQKGDYVLYENDLPDTYNE